MRRYWCVLTAVLAMMAPKYGLAQDGPPSGASSPGRFSESRTPPFISPVGRVYRATAAAPDPVAAWFAFVDRNHDGAIDIGELRAEAAVLFGELDLNHDGEIDPDEISRYETIVAPETQIGGGEYGETGRRRGSGDHGKGRGGHGGGRGGGTEGGEAASDDPAPSGGPDRTLETARGAGIYSFLNIPEPVASADADANRGVTLKELQAASDRRFHMLDPGNSGKLTRATLPETPAQRRGHPILANKHRRG